jgi:hypothetical protein
LEDSITTTPTTPVRREFLKAIRPPRRPATPALSTAEVMTPYLLWPAPSSPPTLRRAARFWTSTHTYQSRSPKLASTDGSACHRPLPVANAFRCVCVCVCWLRSSTSSTTYVTERATWWTLLASRRVRQHPNLSRCKLYPPEEHAEHAEALTVATSSANAATTSTWVAGASLVVSSRG